MLLKVKRTLNWFYPEQIIQIEELEKWYTKEAIQILISDGFIEVLASIKPKNTEQ